MKAAMEERSSGGAHFDNSECIDGEQTPWPQKPAQFIQFYFIYLFDYELIFNHDLFIYFIIK